MEIAEVVAKRSHDAETQVGSVLIRASNDTLVSTGYNGFITGAPDHELTNTRPEKYEYIQHSEMNLVANCAKNGISTEGCYVVCTMSPCKVCTRLLVNAGIRKVIAKELYRDFNDVLAMKDLKVTCSKEADGFYHITYDTDYWLKSVTGIFYDTVVSNRNKI
jgi:dCMP deaminase